VEQTDGTALVVREEQVASLLVGTPDDRVTQATQIANALAPVITGKHLYVDISGKRHVLYEGWATLGALVGVFPVTVETREDEGGAWARVEARTLAGAVVGAAEAVCSRDEPGKYGKPGRWADAPRYALVSMAQTRAGSKALRMPLGFIVTLAGFEATPAEEMDGAQTRAPKRDIRTINTDHTEPKGGQKVIPSQAALAGYMREHDLKAGGVLRLLGLDVADEEEARPLWEQYIKDLKDNQGYDDEAAYASILRDISA